MMKKILFLLVFSLLIGFVNAQTLGCCLNPGAGTLTCATERLAQQSECCPAPESSNPSYYNTASGGPSTSSQCLQNFFVQGQSCDQVSQCSLGCCCTSTGGEVKTGLLCTGSGVTFKQGQTDCIAACNIPQCNDGKDNDGNGCKDYPIDSGCESVSDTSEQSGTCLPVAGQNCESISYQPQISLFVAKPMQSEKKMELVWNSECTANIVSTNIYRCAGVSCTNFQLIGSTPLMAFIDEDPLLVFGTTYTYKIEAQYRVQTTKPTLTAKASLGNIECWNQYHAGPFCVHESYYNQYKTYLIQNVAGFSETTFAQNVRNTFTTKLNKAFVCDAANTLTEEGTVCSSTEVCVVSDNNPMCIEKSECNPDENNLFGLFFTQISCESGKYCFFDRSFSSVDACFQCSPSMSCYDYKSRQSCEKDNCFVQNCVWKELSAELGTGTCVNEQEDNCKWCNSAGTEGIESAEATSSVFEQCSLQKATLLSTSQNICYYDGANAMNCNTISCASYLAADCKTTVPQYNEFNIIINKNDPCSIGTCQLFNSACKKNADKDTNADCTNPECEQDVYAPNTTLVPNIERGLYKSISIQVLDKAIGKGSPTLRTTNNYKTFLCLEPCGQNGHPYDKYTNGFTLVITNLKVFDAVTGQVILQLSEDQNTLRYYSQDPAKNLGEVKKLSINSPGMSTAPVVFQLNITGASIQENAYYTKNRKPDFNIEFYEPATVTSARLLLQNTQIAIAPTFTAQLTKKHTMTLPSNLNPGIYSFEITAKNNKSVFMDTPFITSLVIDNQMPQLQAISPALNEVIKTTTTTITLTFDGKTFIDSLLLNGLALAGNFSSLDKITYRATMPIADGPKELTITAHDYASNTANFSSTFVVNAKPLEIILKNPQYGVAPVYIFDLQIQTDNDASCRYSLDDNLQFDFMNKFDTSGGIIHSKNDFSEIVNGDKRTHMLYVRCNDPIQGSSTKIFDLAVDTEPPQIKTWFAFPNPVVEDPRKTSLRAETDKETICKYSTTATNPNSMEGLFANHENKTFLKVGKAEIQVESDGSYTYHIACFSRSGLSSTVKDIAFTANINLPIAISSNTPAYSNSSSITLSIETNKQTQCKYSATDPTGSQGTLFGEVGHTHTKPLSLAAGNYIYYVTCKDPSQQRWSSPLQVKFTIDTSAPIMSLVDDTSTLPEYPEFTWQADKLRGKWLGTDAETEVSSYFYTIEEFGTLTTIVNWTQTAIENEWVWVTKLNGSLNLLPGSKYYFRVKARNIVGLTSEPKDSDGISIDPTLKPANCSNSVFDNGETDIDCGGICDLCMEGLKCIINTDCRSGFCNENNICKGPTCSDGLRNQDETDIDCGGNSCGKCSLDNQCFVDNDCASNFCSFGRCEVIEGCSDGKLTNSESDIDCGGACPSKCSSGGSCNSVADCDSGLQCIGLVCKYCNQGDDDCNGVLDTEESDTGQLDTDGDGIPDQWELDNGLNPTDPSDAESDTDGDGLLNRDEYIYRTSPIKADTDGDGISDKTELDKNTDPLDPESKPSRALLTWMLWTFLFIVLVALVLAGYYFYETKHKSSSFFPVQRPIAQRPLQRGIPLVRTAGKPSKQVPEILKQSDAKETSKPEDKAKIKRPRETNVFQELKMRSKEEFIDKVTNAERRQEHLSVDKLKSMSKKNGKK